MSPSCAEIKNKQGSVVAVQGDMILVRYDSKGVLFKKNVMKTRAYKNDEIVQFSARKATTVDKEVGDWLHMAAGYPVEWVGTEIKFIKMGRQLRGEGIVMTIRDSQYMFVDWRFTPEIAPKASNINGRVNPTNVFVTRSTVRPEPTDLREVFKTGDRVKYVAREQAPNERGVCWRTIIATDQYHEIAVDTPTAYSRNNYKVIPKAGALPPKPKGIIVSTTVSRPSPNSPAVPKPVATAASAWNIPKTSAKALDISPPKKEIPPKFEIQTPPPVDGFDYFDTSDEACAARFKNFAENYRKANPADLFSKPTFEGFLKMKYLQHITDELTAIQAVK